MKNGWWIAGAGVITTALIIIGGVIIATSDRTAPEIRVQDIGITYNEGDSESVLLAGVSAIDKKDGDVTASIIIEGVVMSKDKSYAKVCYVAKDKSNNISRAYRTVRYNADGSQVGDDELADATVGDSDSKEPETQNSNKQEMQGTTENSHQTDGETQSNGPAVNGARPVLTLKATETTITVGQRFNVVSYVADITDDKDDRNTLFTRIIMDGECDTDVAGDYQISVYCTDTDTNASEKKILTVHVTE